MRYFVTGATGFVGGVVARQLLDRGHQVVTIARDLSRAAEIEKLGRKAVPVLCDVSEIDQIDAMFEKLDAEYGRIDILCNIAGEGVRADPLTITQQQLIHAMQGLFFGRFHITQHAGKRMVMQGKGSIMSIVSIGGISSLGRSHFAYAAAMAAGAQFPASC